MRKLSFWLLVLFMIAAAPASAQTDRPVVRAVLFWAEGCPHCHLVIDDVLPPLQLRYGAQLDIQMIEVSQGAFYEYFSQVQEQYRVPAELRGVPALFIGDRMLVGDVQIKSELPALIEAHLQAGGVGYPGLPDLATYLPEAASPAAACAPATLCIGPALESVNFAAQAPAAALAQAPEAAGGFGLAWAVMAFMALALLYALLGTVQASRGGRWPLAPEWADNLVPLLAVAGLGVAGYLTYVETQQVAAICGPVGDCNAVQASPYARLFGVLPVGLLGAAGYIAILAAWAVGRWGRGALAGLAPLAIFGMSLFALLFSAYLTYLELFVIHAVCMWCLSSAVIITLIMVLSFAPAMVALGGEVEGADDREAAA